MPRRVKSICARVAGAQLRSCLFQAGSVVVAENSVRGRAPRRMWPKCSIDSSPGLREYYFGLEQEREREKERERRGAIERVCEGAYQKRTPKPERWMKMTKLHTASTYYNPRTKPSISG